MSRSTEQDTKGVDASNLETEPITYFSTGVSANLTLKVRHARALTLIGKDRLLAGRNSGYSLSGGPLRISSKWNRASNELSHI
jgi:hypothetical protein